MICMHDAWLSTSTDVEDREEFEDRKRSQNVGGRNRTDFFTNDFTLDEIKTLFVVSTKSFLLKLERKKKYIYFILVSVKLKKFGTHSIV